MKTRNMMDILVIAKITPVVGHWQFARHVQLLNADWFL